MRLLLTTIILGLLLGSPVLCQPPDSTLDDNTAFYEGDKLSYVISPPDGFALVMEDAIVDGYSFAFIPEDETYDSATIRIGINIYRMKEGLTKDFTIDDIIGDDTTAIREHFGVDIVMNEVDSVVTKKGYTIRNFFLNDTTAFIPNVMISYLDGGSEILIFDLSITDEYPRFMAEQIYMECLELLKVLVNGTLEAG